MSIPRSSISRNSNNSGSSSRRKLLLNTVSVDLSCSCRRPKFLSIFNPKPKSSYSHPIPYSSKPLFTHLSHSSSSSSSYPFSSTSTTTTTTTSSSPSLPADGSATTHPRRRRRPTTATASATTTDKKTTTKKKSTLAVEKDSVDPYIDFRASMLQMIVENEIYTKDQLRELLNCFLRLNSPCLHGVIIRAFTDIWNSFFFPPTPQQQQQQSLEDVNYGTNNYNHSRYNDDSYNYNYNCSNGRFQRGGYYASPKVYGRFNSFQVIGVECRTHVSSTWGPPQNSHGYCRRSS